MPEILSTLTQVIDTAKKLRELSKKIQDADTRHLIADLNLELADLKMQVADLQEENVSLHKQIRDSQQTADLRDKLEMRDGLYYLTEPVPGKQEGPYCTNCFETKQTLMPVKAVHPHFSFAGKYNCPACKSYY